MTLQNDKNSKDPFHNKFQQIADRQNLIKSESTEDWLSRNVLQNVARSGETILGMPGNLKKAYKQSRDYLSSFLTDSAPSLEKSEEQLFGKSDPGTLSDFFFNPPTSDELREGGTKKVSELMGKDREFLEPKTPKEKKVGEFTQDLTAMFMPGSQQRMLTRIGAPLLGNLAQEGVKYLGGDESTAEKAKLGVMLTTSIAGNSNPAQFARDRIGQAKNMIPQNATVSTIPLINNIVPIFNRLTRGFRVPSKSRTMQGIQELAQRGQGGRISLQDLMEARDNINEWISEAGGWDIPTNTRDASVRNLNDLKRQIITSIDDAMDQRFPQAGELYRTGYEAAAVTHRSNAISNFIEKHFGKKVASASAKALFPAIAGGTAILPKTAGVAGVSFPLYKTGQVLYRIGSSPTLAGYYTEVLRNATIANAPAMIRNLEKLDKALLKEEKKKGKNKNLSLEEFKSKFMNKDSGNL